MMWGWHVYGARVYADDKSGALEFNVEYNSKNIYWQEAVRVYERLLSFSLSAGDRESVIRQIVPLYCRIGEWEKAKILAENQTSVAVSKEMLLPEATVGEEKNRYQSERIVEFLSKLKTSVFEYVSLRCDINDSEYGKQVILSVINMYESIFDDGRFGSYHWDIGHLYLQMARYESASNGKMQDALAYFDKGFEHYKEYEHIYNMEEYKYSAPLVSSLEVLKKGKLAPLGKNFWKQNLMTYPANIIEELRKNEKYAECFE
ncbi:MAG: hypothetical protein IJW21_04455 [Clostridia bacterium]|nr:hypothetical protein [Clostridia bacterium]